MKPEDVLDPEAFPPELDWIAKQHRLNPDDPVFLILAWHWSRVNAAEDKVRVAIAEMKGALDARIATLTDAAETVAGVNEALADVQAVLQEKPEILGRQFEQQLRQPISQTLVQLQTLEKSLRPLAQTFQSSQRRQLLAAGFIGLVLGLLAAIIVLLA